MSGLNQWASFFSLFLFSHFFLSTYLISKHHNVNFPLVRTVISVSLLKVTRKLLASRVSPCLGDRASDLGTRFTNTAPEETDRPRRAVLGTLLLSQRELSSGEGHRVQCRSVPLRLPRPFAPLATSHPPSSLALAHALAPDTQRTKDTDPRAAAK